MTMISSSSIPYITLYGNRASRHLLIQGRLPPGARRLGDLASHLADLAVYPQATNRNNPHPIAFANSTACP